MVWIVRLTLGLSFAMVVCRLLNSASHIFFQFWNFVFEVGLLGKYCRSRKFLKMKLLRKRESVPDWYVTVFFPSRVFFLSQWMLMYALMYLRSLRRSYLCGRKFYFHYCVVIVIMQFDYQSIILGLTQWLTWHCCAPPTPLFFPFYLSHVSFSFFLGIAYWWDGNC